jgi:hypothetical protein
MELKEIIEHAKKAAPNPIILEVIEELEAFAGMIKGLEGINPEERGIVMEHMSQSYDQLKSKFMRAAASYGMTLDQLEMFLDNPGNFSPAEWAEMQAVKLQVFDHFELKSENKCNKLNKNKKV